MGFAAPGALALADHLSFRVSSRFSARSPGLLLLCLSTSSLLAAASSTRYITPWGAPPAPTCPSSRPFSSTCHASNAAPSYTYRIAASYSAKSHKLAPDTNLFTQKSLDTSKPSFSDLKQCKQHTDTTRPRPLSGQDAFFVARIGATTSTAFGVADGVGGWADSGVDPADFAHGLCDYMACAARLHPSPATSNSSKPGPLRPKDLLQVAFDEVMADKSILGGGSTASVAIASAAGSVEIANLGDSGFLHLRAQSVKHVSRPQTHAFNTPYQLSKTPERMLVQMAVFGTGPLADLPKDANVSSHAVRHGDVLLFATDGVWDNLSPQDALGVVSRCMLESGAWVQSSKSEVNVSADLAALTATEKGEAKALQARLALAITKEAKETSLNTRRDGPFAKEVHKYYPEEGWHGGKPDDIAAVVAVVVEDGVV